MSFQWILILAIAMAGASSPLALAQDIDSYLNSLDREIGEIEQSFSGSTSSVDKPRRKISRPAKAKKLLKPRAATVTISESRNDDDSDFIFSPPSVVKKAQQEETAPPVAAPVAPPQVVAALPPTPLEEPKPEVSAPVTAPAPAPAVEPTPVEEPKPVVTPPAPTPTPAHEKQAEVKVEEKKEEKKVEEKHEPKHEKECAKNHHEFQNSPMLKEALGENYNAWSRWADSMGTTIKPSGGNSMTIYVPAMGKMLGYEDTRIEVEICVTAKDKTPYLMILGKRYHFNDKHGNSLTLSMDGQSTTFVRSAR